MVRDKSASPGEAADELVPMTQTASTASKGRGEASLKRGRAESVEPAPSEPPLPATAPKKNRVAPSTGQPPSKPLDRASSPNLDTEATATSQLGASKPPVSDTSDVLKPSDPEDLAELKKANVANGKEGNVGEVRRQVEKMTYEEGIDIDSEVKTTDVNGQEEDGSVELELPPKEDKPDSAMSLETRLSDGDQSSSAVGTEKTKGSKAEQSGSETKEGEGLKRKALERSQSSFVDDTAAPKKAKDDEEEAKPTTTAAGQADAPSAPPPAKKSQATFSSFSSKPSPFAAKASSPFASAGASSPSPFASAGASGSSAASAAPSVFAKSGFGNYSSSFSPFAKPTPKPNESKDDEEEEVEVKEPKKTSSFGDKLKADTGADEDDDAEKLQMTEQDVHTGEEDEDTVYQTRTKLYVMQADGGWRERGVGTLRLNVRHSDGKAPRIIMRAEGVLRLILNVSLYVGMTCLEDGKHVRMTVFEDGEKRFVTFRTGSAKNASEMHTAIHEHIPLDASDAGNAKDKV